MNYDAVIFDLDGTLLDSLEDLSASMNRTLAAHNFPPHPKDAYRYFVGQGMLNLSRSVLPEGTDENTVASVLAMMEEDYGKNWAVASRPYPGVETLLGNLREKNLRLAVFSNKPDKFTKIIVEKFFPAGMFAHVQGAKPEVPIKPNPAGALEIAKKFGLPPARMIYVGDTDTDMRTGKSAGMFTVGVEWGFRPEQLAAGGADAVISRAEDLPPLL